MADIYSEKEAQNIERSRKIIRTSLLGIAANLLLAAFKAAVGVLSNSIAIILDAVNNLSDAASSLITIIGTKLAGKSPDRKHPFGHGRIEYLSATLIAVLVLYAGFTSLTESVKKILHPEQPEYTSAGLLIIAAAVLVKILLGRHVKRAGEKLNSESLVNSGTDATMDAVISASTLAAALIYLASGLSLEAWLGAAISILIIRSGAEMLHTTISEILGQRADISLVTKIKKTAKSVPGVLGAYDLVLHNYGPDHFNGSMHVEVPDTLSASEIARIQEDVTTSVLREEGVLLTGISIYCRDSVNEKAAKMREEIRSIVENMDHVLQMHGFSVREAEHSMHFDCVVDWGVKDRNAYREEIREAVQKRYPDYNIRIVLDSDMS